MSFIPHTQSDVEQMLATIGIRETDELFDEIPSALQCEGLPNIPPGVSEMNMLCKLTELAQQDRETVCFLGAGSYDHYIPAAVWDLASRGEFLTAYTPYQAEASQGTLQLLYEFQSMLASLTGMEVANASVYDGATATAEAILMAVRLNRKSKQRRVLVPATLHPHYLATVKSIVSHQNIDVRVIPAKDGCIDIEHVDFDGAAAVVVQQPNFFGVLENTDDLCNQAQAANALVIGVVNPITLGLLKPPGEWGTDGADIACGDGQPLGIPMASGGPSFGFLCTRMQYARQLPGRIAGRTFDPAGNPGFVLTLQAREQHIRRAKATSNICTNQGLLVTAATIYMTLLGPRGLVEVGEACYQNTHALIDRLTQIEHVHQRFSQPFFHECVLDFDRPARLIQEKLLNHGILGGWPLDNVIENGEHAMLLCATERRTKEEIDLYCDTLKHG